MTIMARKLGAEPSCRKRHDIAALANVGFLLGLFVHTYTSKNETINGQSGNNRF
jgi:hypothetical protein